MDDKYDLPEEIHEIFLEGQAAEECRDKCIQSYFRAKRAIYYGKEAKRAYDKAWKMINELWPETQKGKWQYNFRDKQLKKREI